MDILQRIEIKHLREKVRANKHKACFPTAFIEELSHAENKIALINTISHWIKEILQADRSSIAFIDKDSQTFKVFALTGNDAIPADKDIPLGETSLGRSVKGKCVHISNDNSQVDISDRQSLSKAGLMSHINVPLIIDDEVVGTINMASKDKFAYGEEHASFLLSLAMFLSTYLRNINQLERIALQTKKEKELIAKSLEASKLAALGQMSGGIAHEINNPMALLSGLCTKIRILEKTDRLTSESLKEIVGTFEKTIDRVVTIIRGLQSFSRESSQEELILEPLGRIIDNTLSLCREKFLSNGIDLRYSREKRDLLISCQPTQASQVLLNLLNNAYDAVSELEDKWVEIEIKEDENSAMIFVKDSGSGICSSVQAKLMDPFFTTKPIGKGTGLGLSIAHGIMQGHDGTLGIDDSQENTCFVMSFPKKTLSQPTQTF